MSAEHNSIKGTSHNNEVIANYPGGISFKDRKGFLTTLRDPEWRVADNNEVREADLIRLPYYHPETPEQVLPQEISASTAKEILKKMKDGDLSENTLGAELEGNLYSKDGTRLLPKYDGIHFTAENDQHPEKVDSMIEVATGTLVDGRLPSSPIEIAHTLAHAVLKGHEMAQIRDGLFVIASVPEGADSKQIRLTKHPYILKTNSNKSGKDMLWRNNIPEEALTIHKQVGLKDIDPFNAGHFHVGNPKIPESDLFDPRIAVGKGLIRLTQLNKISSLMLYNTQDYVGHHLEGITDVRAIIRRVLRGTHDAEIPWNAYEYFQEAKTAVENGDVHSFSRYPRSGQHDRLRIKEFGSDEDTDSPANPDLRHVLAKIFFNQLTEIPGYEAMEAVQGDEAKVIPYLQASHGEIFNIIPSLKGKDSSFQQDLLFNRERFAGKVQGVSFAEQIGQARAIIRQLGKNYPVFQTQARIVDHVYNVASQPPEEKVGLDAYLDTASGMKPGIVTDYLYPTIEDNILARAEGTRKQAEALLRVQDEKDLLTFFGIKSPDSVTIYSRQ